MGSSVSEAEAVQVLVRLGLTCNQARVYLTLVRSGMSTAKTISKSSGVAREDIYRIIPKLHQLGLVAKRLDTPSAYTAVPVQAAFMMLIKNRKQATAELEAKAKEIIQNFKNNTTPATEEEPYEFILIPKEAAAAKRKMMINDAQKRLDFVTSWERFTQPDASIATNLRNALKRNVEIRVIMSEPKGEKSSPELFQSWISKYPLFKPRWVQSTPEARLMLVDEKKVLFAKSAEASFEESPFLWSTNRSFVSVVQNYFDMLWLASFEIKTTNESGFTVGYGINVTNQSTLGALGKQGS